MSTQSLKTSLADFEKHAEALYNAKDAREALRAQDTLATAFARIVANLCDNAGVAVDFDSAFDEGEHSNLENRIALRLAQLRAERRVIARDKLDAGTGSAW